jgi:hypothetical protein
LNVGQPQLLELLDGFADGTSTRIKAGRKVTLGRQAIAGTIAAAEYLLGKRFGNFFVAGGHSYRPWMV